MTVDEVLAAVPGGVRYKPPDGHDDYHPAVLAGHDDIEVAGVDAAARFGFSDGALTQVTIVIRHDSTQGEAVFAVQQLVVLLGEEFGTATAFSDSAMSRAAASQEEGRAFHVVWSGGVEVELNVTVREGRARGTITASVSRSAGSA